jgi:hypothetical protein
MYGTGEALELSSVAEGHAWLVVALVALSVLPICATAIILVLSVDRRDRVRAIEALAPVLSRARLSWKYRSESGPQEWRQAGSARRSVRTGRSRRGAGVEDQAESPVASQPR